MVLHRESFWDCETNLYNRVVPPGLRTLLRNRQSRGILSERNATNGRWRSFWSNQACVQIHEIPLYMQSYGDDVWVYQNLLKLGTDIRPMEICVARAFFCEWFIIHEVMVSDFARVEAFLTQEYMEQVFTEIEDVSCTILLQIVLSSSSLKSFYVCMTSWLRASCREEFKIPTNRETIVIPFPVAISFSNELLSFWNVRWKTISRGKASVPNREARFFPY